LNQSTVLVLDTRDLKIARVEKSKDSSMYEPTQYRLGTRDKILGSPLTIDLPEGATTIRVQYATSPNASGLQWLEPSQTAGKKHPFLYTQSEAIHARSWIPLQDKPGFRVTYSARIRTPDGLSAVMGAEMLGNGTFRMEQPIPSYLIALAV